MNETAYQVAFWGKEFLLNPVAFSVKGIPIYWYGIIIATGFLAAMIYGFRRSGDYNINNDAMIDVVLVGAIGAIICARAYYVLTSIEEYGSFKEMLDIRSGGLAIYGAILGALVFGGLTCHLRKINILDMFDLVAPAFLIGQAIGRWGNFMNQEAFGTNTNLPWGMWSDNTFSYLDSQYDVLQAQGINVSPYEAVHPCFLYESLWCVVGFVLIHFLSKHRYFKGQIILEYAAWYGLGRFFIEQLRTDSLMVGSFRISQILAGACFLLGVITIITISLIKAKRKTKADAEAETEAFIS